MASEWKQVVLSDVIEIISGGTPKTSIPEYWGGSIPWLSVADFNNGYRWVNTAEKSITESGLNESATTILNEGDIIISARGTVGAVAQLAKPMAFNQSCYGIRGKKGLADTNFIYYSLLYAVSKIKMVSHGGVFETITRDTFDIIKVDIPPYKEQLCIAQILGALDDKIEVTRQMDKTLEAMAQALFKSWFVDFDPVHAKTEGRNTGLPKSISALFPEKLEDSELGKIPKRWEIKSIGEAVKCVGGSTPSTKNPALWDGGLNPFVTPKDMSLLKSPVILETARYITDEGVDTISSGSLPSGTVLLSSRAPIGYLAITEVPVSINQGIIAMICEKELPNYYVLYWTETNMETIKSNAGGTTFAEISKRNFRPIKVIVPNAKILDAFVQQVEPLYRRLVLNTQESNTLSLLCKNLLPKLISGAVRVENLDRFLTEAI